MNAMRGGAMGALALGLVLCAATPGLSAPADKSGREAARASADATRALARSEAETAVALAERAVALAPADAGYRALLGRSYVRAGRFASARVALEEALSLDPRNGRAALDLALAQAADGDGDGARATLAAHQGDLSATDLGLALALAGDPQGGARMLIEAARQPGADARTRQNLAVALALSGDWTMARVIAAADVAPDKLDRRIADWALMADPGDSAGRVARFLGVARVADPGRPAVLALVRPAPVEVADSASAPASAGALAPKVEVAEAVVTTPVSAPIRFAARQEVVQALPGTASAGRWYVQVGAFRTEEGARDGWDQARRRMPALASYTPAGVPVRRGDGALYRVSFGGFDQRRAAVETCERFRATGGRCFVRTYAGERLVDWLRRDETARS